MNRFRQKQTGIWDSHRRGHCFQTNSIYTKGYSSVTVQSDVTQHEMGCSDGSMDSVVGLAEAPTSIAY